MKRTSAAPSFLARIYLFASTSFAVASAVLLALANAQGTVGF